MIIRALKIIHVFFLIAAGVSSAAQEVVSALSVNRVVRDSYNKLEKLKSALPGDTLDLPFFDDFSWSGPFPADTLWSDNNVFINNTLSSDQVSMGIATFDMLGNNGLLYPHASTTEFEADHLTSQPIDLAFNPSDSAYLSFFYEPGGLSDLPDQNDSLVLQFFAPSSSSWHSVWKTEGAIVHPFRSVAIPVSDTAYLKRGFRFRFINYATLSSSTSDPGMIGNADLWHIDYIYLDTGRTSRDTLPADVAFTKPLRSVLNTYESMPWDQFREVYLSEMGTALEMNYRNNDSIVRNVSRMFNITDVYENSVVHTKSPVATNINPYQEVVYDAPVVYTFNTSGTDSALFRLKAVLVTDDFDPKQNDTITYDQVFNNWFAYDDGSSEAGYGVNGDEANTAMVAVRFRSYITDTLRAVNICFNDSYLSSNHKYFDVAVWSESNGWPSDLLYSQDEVLVDPGSSVNGFTTYRLDQPVQIDGYFFVGWRQRSKTFLNAGFDLNKPSTGKLFYYYGGVWNQSQKNGTLMVRPVFGPEIPVTSVGDVRDINPGIKIWPNPVSDILYFKMSSELMDGKLMAEVYDNSGRLVFSKNTSGEINVSALKPGIYFLVLKNARMVFSHNKFIRTTR